MRTRSRSRVPWKGAARCDGLAPSKELLHRVPDRLHSRPHRLAEGFGGAADFLGRGLGFLAGLGRPVADFLRPLGNRLAHALGAFLRPLADFLGPINALVGAFGRRGRGAAGPARHKKDSEHEAELASRHGVTSARRVVLPFIVASPSPRALGEYLDRWRPRPP